MEFAQGEEMDGSRKPRLRSRPRALFAGLAVFVVAATAAGAAGLLGHGAAANAEAVGTAATGPGCDPSRPAIAHYATPAMPVVQPPGAPTPCGVYTGFPSGETRIGVTNSGTLIFSPAAVDVAGVNLGIGEPLGPGFIGVAISHVNGGTWSGI